MLKILLAIVTVSKESEKAKDYTNLNFMQNVRIKNILTGFPFYDSYCPVPKYLICLDILTNKTTSNLSLMMSDTKLPQAK